MFMNDIQPPFTYLFASSEDAIEGFSMSCQNRLANVERTLVDLLGQFLRLQRDERISRSLLCLRRASADAPEFSSSIPQFDPLTFTPIRVAEEHPHPCSLRSSMSRGPCEVEILAASNQPRFVLNCGERDAGPNRDSSSDDAPQRSPAAVMARKSSTFMFMAGRSHHLHGPRSSESTDVAHLHGQSLASSFPMPLRSAIHAIQTVAVVPSRRSKPEPLAHRTFHAVKHLLHANEFSPCAKIA